MKLFWRKHLLSLVGAAMIAAGPALAQQDSSPAPAGSFEILSSAAEVLAPELAPQTPASAPKGKVLFPLMSRKSGSLPIVLTGENAAKAPPAAHGNDCGADCGHRRWHIYGFADFLVWRADAEQTPYAGTIVPITGAGIAGASRDIQAADVNYGSNAGYRLGFGGRNEDGWDVGFVYTFFTNHGQGSLGNAAADGDNIYLALLDRSLSDNAALNGGFDSGIGDFAAQSLDLELIIYDVNVGKTIHPCENWELTPFMGLRYVDFSQNSVTSYVNLEGAADTDTYTLLQRMDMRAYGLRGGLNFDWAIRRSGLSIFGGSAASILFSEIDAQREDAAFNQSLGTTQIRRYRASVDSSIPVLDARVGVRYVLRNFSVAAGYELSHWFNLNTGIDVPGWDDIDGNTANYRVSENDLSFRGWFFQAGVTY